MYPALTARIQALLEARENPVLIAIDGPAGSGKSSLAAALHHHFPGSLVIHADGFFLQPHQRTQARLDEPGGNLDRERLLQQVIIPVKAGRYQGHQRFNCQTGSMEEVPGALSPLVILEGSYCHHPGLRGYYDLTVFLDIDEAAQLQRLKARCPSDTLLSRFKNAWIPLENTYFKHFNIRAKADLIV